MPRDMTTDQLLQRIKDALATDENGEALIEVARNACRAEMELASMKMQLEEGRQCTIH